MPANITMPQQSDTMTEGTLVAWVKNEGDAIKEGDVVAEIETDKATMEMEGPDEPGTIAAILVQAGETAAVGQTLAVVALEGEDVADVKNNAGSGGGAKKAEGGEEKAETSTATATEDEAVEREPAAPSYEGSGSDTTMPMPAADGESSNGTGGNGTGGRIKASPLAKRIAKNKNIDLSGITGTGPGGRIVQKDVLDFEESGGSSTTPKPTDLTVSDTRTTDGSAKSGAPKTAALPLPSRIGTGETETIELSKMRQTIAKRLQQSKQTIPHFYESVDIELDAAEALRASLNKTLEKEGTRLSIGDLIAKAVAVTLKVHPVLNSTYDGTKITRHGDVHLGMAVALPDGLIVPVLKNIDQMGFREIRLRSKELVDKARAQKLKGDEMSGATFTVSNLGGFGIKEFSAIVNPPEVGILAIGAGSKRAVVAADGSIVARSVMTVTLSADHRAVDGADSARFLGTLKQMLEEPGMMLV
jgi:pyruvate dehydrogenase E2 component (dihydrolipoamide acetyltransferase)